MNAIAVGSIRTEALDGVLSDEIEAAMVAQTPMGKIGDPEDIAAAILGHLRAALAEVEAVDAELAGEEVVLVEAEA